MNDKSLKHVFIGFIIILFLMLVFLFAKRFLRNPSMTSQEQSQNVDIDNELNELDKELNNVDVNNFDLNELKDLLEQN